ncbi:hypothetical protein [Lactococcus formosensis]|uniref:hypothetical protein n=1 Tax=Lactococcus formosensis TaxID=1281486 RepID=UPI00254A1E80|nr:hypothetical protein [Lactococcus formosensis]
MAIGLIVIAIGSFIAGAACVGIQLEKMKKQRDEALEAIQKAYDLGFDQGYVFYKKHKELLNYEEKQDEEV